MDRNADLMQMGDYTRISYSEDNGARVVLDINGGDVSMKRHSEGLTHATFSMEGTSSLSVHSEHGILEFGVITVASDFNGDTLYINYQLLQGGETIDTHVFELSWKLEE